MRLFSKGVPTLGVLNHPRATSEPQSPVRLTNVIALCRAQTRFVLAGPGLVVRGGPDSVQLDSGGTHVVWALTVPEHGTSDTCGLIAWTIDLLSNIMWEARLLQRPKQLKIINHKVRKRMHSTAQSECASLPPSRAIGNVLFPTYEVVTSLLHSIFLLNE